MTSIIVLAIGAGAAGFILGALLVHWAYRPVRYEKAPHEQAQPCTLPQLAELAPIVDVTTLATGKPENKGNNHDRR